MTIIKDWKTLELIEFLNSFRAVNSKQVVSIEHFVLMYAVRRELTTRQPLIGLTYISL